MVSGKGMVNEIFTVLSELKISEAKHKSHRNEVLSVNSVDSVFIQDLVFTPKGENPLRYPTYEFKFGESNLISRKNGTEKLLTDLITGLHKKCRKTRLFKKRASHKD